MRGGGPGALLVLAHGRQMLLHQVVEGLDRCIPGRKIIGMGDGGRGWWSGVGDGGGGGRVRAMTTHSVSEGRPPATREVLCNMCACLSVQRDAYMSVCALVCHMW